MQFALSRLLALALGGAFLACSITGQDVRELSQPTGQQTLLNATPATITNAIQSGLRLTDLEHRSGSGAGIRFNATLVQNAGAYATGWFWNYDLSAAQLSTFIASNSGRLIDLEAYEDANGGRRFACVLVPNTGSNAKAWWYYFDTTPANLGQQATANNARLVDLDSYRIGANTYYLGVMIRNTGADARVWWWYTGQTTAQITATINTNQARLYDLGRNTSGSWDCIMLQDVTPASWYWWPSLSAADVGYLIQNFGVRPTDIEMYFSGFFLRYSMVTINNSNMLTTAVGDAMRSTTDGQVGCWLEQINGPNLANLNGDTVFEPASTMKTLHHVHAMRRVNLGAVSLTQPINVFTNYSSTNASCPIDSGAVNQQLSTVLSMMMQQSDNARTQAITAFFGEPAINATASTLGMASTSLNHRLGCGAEALADPNQTTLRDLHELHDRVANGFLGSQRSNFYSRMLDSITDLSLNTMISQEAASLGLPLATTQTFRAFTQQAHKGGSYSLSTGGPQFYHRAEFGYLRLPFVTNGVVTPREYGFGLFVNQASNDAQASSAIYNNGIPELLRPTIRAALQTWTGNLATTQSIGAGCGTPQATQQFAGLPRVGTSPSYGISQGYPSALAAFVLGTSTSMWNGVPLPLALGSIGGEPGCFAYNDAVAAELKILPASGLASTSFAIPNDYGLIGFEYLTQYWTFAGSAIKTTNSLRNRVGL